LPGGVGVGSVAAWIMAGKRKSHSRRNAVFLAVSMPFLVKQCARMGKENQPGRSGKECCCKDFFERQSGLQSFFERRSLSSDAFDCGLDAGPYFAYPNIFTAHESESFVTPARSTIVQR